MYKMTRHGRRIVDPHYLDSRPAHNVSVTQLCKLGGMLEPLLELSRVDHSSQQHRDLSDDFYRNFSQGKRFYVQFGILRNS
jgi:hypothetical protein